MDANTREAMRCDCGAEMAAIEIIAIGESDPSYIPGEFLEPCTCPRCPFCSTLVDCEGRCENLNCTYVGLHVAENVH
jgi:hypothetical protein